MIEAGDKVRHTTTGRFGIVASCSTQGWFSLLGDPSEAHNDEWQWDVVASLDPVYGDQVRVLDDEGKPNGPVIPCSGFTYAEGKCHSVRVRYVNGLESVLPRSEVGIVSVRNLEARARGKWPELFATPVLSSVGLTPEEVVEHFSGSRQAALCVEADPVGVVSAWGDMPLPPLGEKLTLGDFLKEQPSSAINPTHYSQWKFQPIEFIQANDMPFWLGNVIKYACRAEQKNGVEDLQKAREYLQFKINELEGRQVTDNG